MQTQISIHAPAKGATSNNKNIFDDTPISIHAPAKGATVEERPEDMAAAFQSTLPRRERPMIGVEAYENWNFNPRSREGSDLSENVYKLVQGDFNPRSREGSDCCP